MNFLPDIRPLFDDPDLFFFFSFLGSFASLATPLSLERLESSAVSELSKSFGPVSRLDACLFLNDSTGALSLCWSTEVDEVGANSLAAF